MKKILVSRHDKYIFDDQVYDIPSISKHVKGADLRYRTNVFLDDDMDFVLIQHNNRSGRVKNVEFRLSDYDVELETFLISIRFIEKNYVTHIVDTVGDVANFNKRINW